MADLQDSTKSYLEISLQLAGQAGLDVRRLAQALLLNQRALKSEVFNLRDNWPVGGGGAASMESDGEATFLAAAAATGVTEGDLRTLARQLNEGTRGVCEELAGLAETLAAALTTPLVHGDFGPGWLENTGSEFTANKVTRSTASPTINDDGLAGYTVGSLWFNTLVDTVFVCMDDTTGAAVWRKTTGTAVPFMIDVTDADGNPTVNYEDGTVPADKVVSSVEYQSGELTVTIHGEVDSGPENFTPVVTITGWNVSGSPVSVTEAVLGTDTRRYQFSQAITLTGEGTVYIKTADGGVHGVPFTEASAPPNITTFTHGTPPGEQTRVKNGDSVAFDATFPAGADTFVLENFELHGTTAQEYPIDVTDTSISDTFTVAGADGNPHNIQAHLKMPSDATGDSKESTNAGLHHDSTVPAIGTIVVSNFPSGPPQQYALKDDETCLCTSIVSDYDSIVYSNNGTGELSIPDTEVYTAGKTVTRTGGTYRVTGANYKIVASKSSNDTSTTGWRCVKICNAAATLTMTGATSRLRSKTGGDKSYGMTLSADYQLTAFDCDRDAADDGDAIGAWSGTGTGDNTWTNTIYIGEEDTKNTGADSHTWASVVATNIAGTDTVVINTEPDYTVGGFEERDVEFAAFEEYNPIGTMASNKSNSTLLNCEIVGVKELTYVGNDTPAADKFTITDAAGDFDADGTYVRCLDADFIGLGLSYTLRISEDAS